MQEKQLSLNFVPRSAGATKNNVKDLKRFHGGFGGISKQSLRWNENAVLALQSLTELRVWPVYGRHCPPRPCAILRHEFSEDKKRDVLACNLKKN